MAREARTYAFDVSEYFFRLTTESLRLYSNETKRYQTLASLVDHIAPSALSTISEHDVETLREHLELVPSKGNIRIHLTATRATAEYLAEITRHLSKVFSSAPTVADAVSVLLFDYVAERNAAQLLKKLGLDTALQLPERTGSDSTGT